MVTLSFCKGCTLRIHFTAQLVLVGLIVLVIYVGFRSANTFDVTYIGEDISKNPYVNTVPYDHRNVTDRSMTIVTAYFDLGTFRKGPSQKFTPELYLKWANTFRLLNNSLVVYTDTEKFATFMRNLRKGMEHKTKIVVIDRQKLWTFQIGSKIKSIFSQNGYPKHFPNTVIPEYSSAQHSKYAVVAEAIRQHYFNTSFYAWLDIGYFRDLVNTTKKFHLSAPEDIQTERVAFNLVYTSLSLNVGYKQIVFDNIVWVGGGLIIGTANTFLQFEKQYKSAVMFLLNKNLMSTDQQVLLSMYSVQGRKDMKPEIQLQLYFRQKEEKTLINENTWFYLGYKCLTFIVSA